jgi:hypothetical protein
MDFEPFRNRAMNCEGGGTGCYGMGNEISNGMGSGMANGGFGVAMKVDSTIYRQSI